MLKHITFLSFYNLQIRYFLTSTNPPFWEQLNGAVANLISSRDEALNEMGFSSPMCGSFSDNNRTMEDSAPSFHGLKKQASFFFKAKIKMARLAFTDVTPAQLLTEEATCGNPWPPDTPTMRVITRAAFEVDDFCRIVEVLHKRLEKFTAKDWRGSYNAVILVEHLLRHGPQSLAEEFEEDREVLRKMGGFQFVDEKGFNWGLSVRKLSGRVLKLLEDKAFLREERSRARNLTRGIQGFGNFSHRSFPTTADSHSGRYKRYNSDCNDRLSDREINPSLAPASEIFPIDQKKELQASWNLKGRLMKQEAEAEDSKPELMSEVGKNAKVDHPFCEFKHQSAAESLLSSSPLEW